ADRRLPRVIRRRVHDRPDPAGRRRLADAGVGGPDMRSTPISVAGLLPQDLPDGRDAVAEGRAIGDRIEIAPSLYLAEKGARSEREWRERAASQGISSTCIN